MWRNNSHVVIIIMIFIVIACIINSSTRDKSKSHIPPETIEQSMRQLRSKTKTKPSKRPPPTPDSSCQHHDDPNPLGHKYSYDFVFADGTRVRGTSDENNVPVVVAGAEFDLHISCSDEFPGGYGSKGGPKEGQTPMQYPVSEWRVWKYKNVGEEGCELVKQCGEGDNTPNPVPRPPGESSPVSSPSSCPSPFPSGSPTYVPTPSPTHTPTVLPSVTPTAVPTVHPSQMPTGVPSGRPSAVPSSSTPTAIPTGSPTSTPSTFPTSEPSGQPSGFPTGFCVNKDDPNELLHKYSYNFTFADGTQLLGSSDDNVISVTVADATFDLHISCSDDFSGGYGDKDGPIADQMPIQYPVTNYKIWKYKNVGKSTCELKGTCSGPNSDDYEGSKTHKSKPRKNAIDTFGIEWP